MHPNVEGGFSTLSSGSTCVCVRAGSAMTAKMERPGSTTSATTGCATNRIRYLDTSSRQTRRQSHVALNSIAAVAAKHHRVAGLSHAS